jgi:hypothetical protein
MLYKHKHLVISALHSISYTSSNFSLAIALLYAMPYPAQTLSPSIVTPLLCCFRCGAIAEPSNPGLFAAHPQLFLTLTLPRHSFGRKSLVILNKVKDYQAFPAKAMPGQGKG